MGIPEFSIQISAGTVAWYGAVVATLGAGVSIYNAWKDRPRIKIKFEPNQYLVGNPALYKENKKYLCINVVNKGHRSIKIEQASLRQYGSSKNLLLADSFQPHRLKVINEESPRTTFAADQDMFDIDKVYCVVVTDGAGNKYIKYVKTFPTFTIFFYWMKGLFVYNKK